MDIDAVYTEIGEFGIFQKKIFWSLAAMQIFTACQQLHNVYIGAEPEFTCTVNKQIVSGCPEDPTLICDSYNFSGEDFTSIVSEWDLVCGDSRKASLVQSIFMSGYLVGALIFGTLADAYGRRHILCITPIMMSLLTSCGIFASSYNAYIFMRFLTGLFCAGFGIISFTYASEIIGQSKRGFLAMVIPLLFACGIAVFAMLAYFIRDWRMLTLVTAAPGLFGFYLFMVCPESPRWLYSQGRLFDAERLLEHIALKNHGKPTKTAISLLVTEAKASQTKPGFIDIMKHRELRSRALNNGFTWFVNCAVYYGLTMGAGSLGGNMYTSVAFSGLIEMPIYVLTWYLIDRFGRKITYTVSMTFAGTFCVIIMFLPTGYSTSKTVLALLGKMGISLSFCVAWVYAAEMFPTNVRNKGMSMANMAARLGGILSPIILNVGKEFIGLDFFIFGALTLMAAGLSLCLPETANIPMPETIADLDDPRSSPQASEFTISVKAKQISEDKLRLIEGEILANELVLS